MNPWLRIPLADYEGHMSLPEIGQASLMADIFEHALREHRPRSVAVVGCAGGNGFDRIDASVTTRLVGIDLNPAYIERARGRFTGRIPGLKLVAGDIQCGNPGIAPVDLVFAALIFEFVDRLDAALAGCRVLLDAGGRLCTVVQLISEGQDPVTPSHFESVQALSPLMRLVPPDALRERAADAGLDETDRHVVASVGGKQFMVQTFLGGAQPRRTHDGRQRLPR